MLLPRLIREKMQDVSIGFFYIFHFHHMKYFGSAEDWFGTINIGLVAENGVWIKEKMKSGG